MKPPPNLLTIKAGETVYENARLHGSGGLCKDRHEAFRFLDLAKRRGWNVMIHTNYTAQGSDKHHHPASDVEILPGGPS